MIVANWKCNGSREMIHDWLKQYEDAYISFDKTFVGNSKILIIILLQKVPLTWHNNKK